MSKWRSPTGETIYRRHPSVNTRSAGTSRKARRQIKQSDIEWADVICVMEEKHLSRLRRDYRSDLQDKDVRVLDIPDDYSFMSPDLIDLIQDAVQPVIDER